MWLPLDTHIYLDPPFADQHSHHWGWYICLKRILPEGPQRWGQSGGGAARNVSKHIIQGGDDGGGVSRPCRGPRL